ncbi:MAG: RtcB family protein [Candidatus Methylumidiphilus sp.]
MSIQIELNKARVPVKIWTQDIEPQAMQQLLNIAQLPIVHGHIAAMPDVHSGIGATVGSVIPTKHAIIPAAVGVDIGCGMNAVRTTLTETVQVLNTALKYNIRTSRQRRKHRYASTSLPNRAQSSATNDIATQC